MMFMYHTCRLVRIGSLGRDLDISTVFFLRNYRTLFDTLLFIRAGCHLCVFVDCLVRFCSCVLRSGFEFSPPG